MGTDVPQQSSNLSLTTKGFNVSRHSTNPTSITDLVSQDSCRRDFRANGARCGGRSGFVDWRRGARCNIGRSVTAARARLLLWRVWVQVG
jgi:hypothetical protein